MSDDSLRSKNSKIKEKTDPISMIIIFMVAVYPFIVVPGPLNYFRGPRYIILVIIALLSLYLLAREKAQLKDFSYYLLGLFLIFASISTLLARDVATAWLGHLNWYTGLSTFLFCIILFVLASQVENPYRFFVPMAAAASVVSVIAILQHFGLNFIPHELSREGLASFGTMGHPNWLGTYTVLVLPAAIYFYLRNKHLLWLLASALIYAALFVTMTRGAWLSAFAVFIIIAIYFLRKPGNWKPFLKLVVVLAVVTMILLPTSDWGPYERVSSVPDEIGASARLEDRGGSGRIHIWKGAVGAIPENWAFGLGPDNFAEAEVLRSDGNPHTKSHNIYLEILVTMGVFAFASYFAFHFYMLARAWKHSFLFFILIFAYLLRGLFSHDIVEVFPLFWIVLGLSLANEKSLEGSAAKETKGEDLAGAKSVDEQKGINKHRFESPWFRYIIKACLIIFICLMYFWFFFPSHDTVELPCGGTYTGELRGSTFHGEGTWESAYGTTYEGEFRYGYFQGEGEMIYPDGTKYIGEFKEGHMHGEGKMIFSDGTVKEGVWHRGEFQGEGKNDG